MNSAALGGLLVVSMLVCAGVGYFAGTRLTEARTSTLTTSLTTTETALQSSASDSDWSFVVSTNATVVDWQALLLVANLTNTSPSNQTIRPYVEPFVNPRVVAANGTEVWAWDPPEATSPIINMTSGQTISVEVVIPTMLFRDGAYTIGVAPLSSQFPADFNLTLHFTVHTIIYFG
jgi:hypothetical protein